MYLLLQVASAGFDYEMTREYSVRVEVTDSGSPALSESAQFTVHITDSNDSPTDLQFSGNAYSRVGMEAHDHQNMQFF